jgi:internalin A
MIGAATAIAIPIAGMTDFASSAIDVSNKLGIELKLPPAR